MTVPRLEHLFCQIKLKQRISQENAEGVVGNSSINAALLQEILAPRDEDLQKMIRLIQKRVAKEYKLNVSDLKGNSRKQTVVLARGVGIYLTRVLLGSSFLKIGNAFGKRDHSTILHSFRKIESLYLSPAANETPKQAPTAEQKKTNRLIDRLKQELTDLFATQIGID